MIDSVLQQNRSGNTGGTDMETTLFPVIQGDKTGKRLREIRKKRNIRVPSVCAFMGGISEQAVYKWERGACLPSIDNLLALSHLYHVQIEDMLVYEETEQVSYFFLPITVFSAGLPIIFCSTR